MRTHTPVRLPLLLISLLSVLALGPGCKKKKTPVPEEPTEQATTQAEDKRLAVGFLYAGPADDAGYNQAHATGAAAVRKLRGARVVEATVDNNNVPAGFDRLIVLGGASVVFATAPQHYDPDLLNAARKYPQVTFISSGGRYQEGVHPRNVSTIHGYLDESFYVAGVVAGMSTKTRRLGFVAGPAVPSTLRTVNAFTLGARSVNPKSTTSVVFMSSWSDPGAEAKAVDALAAQKVDVVATSVQSPRTVLEAAEKHKIKSIGAHIDGNAYAPQGHLVSAVWNFGGIYADRVGEIIDGKPFPHVGGGGLREGLVSISPFGASVDEEAKKRAMAARQALIQGQLTVFAGPLKNNQGQVALAAGTTMITKDARLETMSYLVDGVIGKLPD